jgi:membrane-bound metal-dependent hydrolase YbcI (DUF457 family)
MMGKTHALTGVAIGVGITYIISMPVMTAITGTLICAGAALLPDIDHNRSTVSSTYGPITKLFSWIVNSLTGGHRRGTHSIVGIGVIWLVAERGVIHRDDPWGQVTLCIMMILCFAGVIRLLKIPGWLDDVAPIPIVIGLVCLTDLPMEIVPPAILIGCAVHVLGDVVTKSGCPLYWPVSKKNVKLALFVTNGKVERWIVTPLVWAAIMVGIGYKLVMGLDMVS